MTMEESLLFDENSPENVALPDVEEAISIKAKMWGSFAKPSTIVTSS